MKETTAYISMQSRERYRKCAKMLSTIPIKCHSTEWRIRNDLGGLGGCKLCPYKLPDHIFDLLNDESRNMRLLDGANGVRQIGLC